MSIIHVNQIKTHIQKIFSGLIDLSDVTNHAPDMQENFFFTRGLAAYSIQHLSGASPQDSASAITDAGNDNGIDALYFDEPNKRLYFIQSKWIKNGIGEPENGDIKKFASGVRDLFNLRVDRFNSKIANKFAMLTAALNDPATRYEVVVVHTGTSKLSLPSANDLGDLTAELNDVSEVLSTTVLSQAELHKSLVSGIAGEPINLQIGLKSWGRKASPHEAIYGQVTAGQITLWWTEYRLRLFARNLRGTLGETEVNAEMRQTLDQRPTDFWYFNNGITLVARSVTRSMVGGGDNDFSTFHCNDVSVVNGAQTVSTIGKYGELNSNNIDNIVVPARIIVRGEDMSFADEVTKANNRQNRIENRDFVTLDPEQNRIRTELAIDGIDYQLMRADSIIRSDTAFDLIEATTALACASGNIRHTVQLKREIGKLWEDIGKAPYKEIFNASIPGQHVWRCVQVQRRIDKAIESYAKRNDSSRNYGLTTHGNRIIAALVFEILPVAQFKLPNFDIDQVSSDAILIKLVDDRIVVLSKLLDLHYPNSIIPTLFKNLKKCDHLVTEARPLLSKTT